MKKIVIIAALLTAIASPAMASDKNRPNHDARPEHTRDGRGERMACSTRPAAEWLSIGQIAQKLKEQSFTVLKIEAKAGCYEVKVTDAKGTALELHVDAVTAEIVRRRDRS